MATYRVECTGEAREVFLVEADSEEEAMARWADGTSIVLEASSMEPVSARIEDD